MKNTMKLLTETQMYIQMYIKKLDFVKLLIVSEVILLQDRK